jgi:hypothetical protein
LKLIKHNEQNTNRFYHNLDIFEKRFEVSRRNQSSLIIHFNIKIPTSPYPVSESLKLLQPTMYRQSFILLTNSSQCLRIPSYNFRHESQETSKAQISSRTAIEHNSFILPIYLKFSPTLSDFLFCCCWEKHINKSANANKQRRMIHSYTKPLRNHKSAK